MEVKMRVVSFCHYLQGPACTQYLADLGADVVKIEPLQGAFERHWSGGKSYVNGTTAFSLAVNRNKRSLAVNLKTEEGKAIVRDLIREADVIVENYRPGTLDRLGFGYDDMRALNPDIIYASASGLGSSGPAAARPGQDLLMQARSGLIAATGDGCVVGAAIVDQHGAALLAMAILAAFARKLQCGKGTRVESSLFSAAIDLQAEALAMYCSAPDRGRRMKRGRNIGSWYHDAPYGLYDLKDARIVLSMNDPTRLAAALGDEELAGMAGIDRYEERERYAACVAAILREWSYADLVPRFERHAIWCERVQDYEDLLNDPQANHNGAFATINVNGRDATVVAHPIRYDGVVPPIRRIPLKPGADTAQLLTELGISAERQTDLASRGIIGRAEQEL